MQQQAEEILTILQSAVGALRGIQEYPGRPNWTIAAARAGISIAIDEIQEACKLIEELLGGVGCESTGSTT